MHWICKLFLAECSFFTILIWLMHEHGISFHFPVPTSLFRGFYCGDHIPIWFEFVPWYFLILLSISLSMISFPVHLLLMYSKAIDLYKLTLYPATLLWLFIAPWCFMVKFFGPPMCSITEEEYWYLVTLYLWIGVVWLLISYLCLFNFPLIF